jgi:hypothetical protein
MTLRLSLTTWLAWKMIPVNIFLKNNKTWTLMLLAACWCAFLSEECLVAIMSILSISRYLNSTDSNILYGELIDPRNSYSARSWILFFWTCMEQLFVIKSVKIKFGVFLRPRHNVSSWNMMMSRTLRQQGGFLAISFGRFAFQCRILQQLHAELLEIYIYIDRPLPHRRGGPISKHVHD